MSRRIECPKCGTMNQAGTVCECVGGSDQRLVRRVRTWQQSGTTPAHGKLMVHPSGKACAVDYGRKVRVFWKRNPRWQGQPAFPHQYSRQETIPANANVDLPDTAAQDSASKSNNPAVSG